MMNEIIFKDIGLIPFLDCRGIQLQLVAERTRGEIGDTIIFCEHPLTLSLGARTKSEHIGLSLDEWKARGVEVVEADRGGSVTLHAPGQLVIYPVIALAPRKLGVRSFVELFLDAIVETLKEFGLQSFPETNPAGIWVRTQRSEAMRKILSLGLRIREKVTDHGFALNINPELSPFTLFAPCGERDTLMTSLSSELPKITINMCRVKESLTNNLKKAFT